MIHRHEKNRTLTKKTTTTTTTSKHNNALEHCLRLLGRARFELVRSVARLDKRKLGAADALELQPGAPRREQRPMERN